MTLIDKDQMEKHIMESKVFTRYFKELVQSLIWGEEAVDSVEVVRCKDCNMSDFYKAGNGKTYCRCLESEKCGLEASDFCSYGHKKEGL